MTDLIERLQAARRKTVAVSATVRAVGANKTTLDRMANTCADAAAEIERQAARIAELEAALTWRPIETAPNEESILILYDDGSVRLIEAEENDLEWRPWQGARGPGVSLPMLWMDATGITSAAVAAIAALNPGDPK